MRKYTRQVSIFSDSDGLIFHERSVISLFRTLDSSKYRIGDGELSIAFLKRVSMCSLHERFMGDCELTDVITFPGNAKMCTCGEICVSPDYAIDAHKSHGTTFPEELTLYLIHGYLHLFGLNDVSTDETMQMRSGEEFCMALVKNRTPKFSYVDLCPCKPRLPR